MPIYRVRTFAPSAERRALDEANKTIAALRSESTELRELVAKTLHRQVDHTQPIVACVQDLLDDFAVFSGRLEQALVDSDEQNARLKPLTPDEQAIYDRLNFLPGRSVPPRYAFRMGNEFIVSDAADSEDDARRAVAILWARDKVDDDLAEIRKRTGDVLGYPPGTEKSALETVDALILHFAACMRMLYQAEQHIAQLRADVVRQSTPGLPRKPLVRRRRRLERRAEHLERRIAAAALTGKRLSYDIAEVSALRTAISLFDEAITKTMPSANPVMNWQPLHWPTPPPLDVEFAIGTEPKAPPLAGAERDIAIIDDVGVAPVSDPKAPGDRPGLAAAGPATRSGNVAVAGRDIAGFVWDADDPRTVPQIVDALNATNRSGGTYTQRGNGIAWTPDPTHGSEGRIELVGEPKSPEDAS